jgi:hypothetical protein
MPNQGDGINGYYPIVACVVFLVTYIYANVQAILHHYN